MKKKPIFSEEFGEHPIMSVAVSNDGLYAVFGNSIGEMRKVDLRTGKVFHCAFVCVICLRLSDCVCCFDIHADIVKTCLYDLL